jgi:hypothetical protein
MAVNNVSHKGRRIYCGRRKEGGRCVNGKTYALEPIEQRVVTALQGQLRDPRAIERYLATYRAERRRLATEGSNKRSVLERGLAQANREIARVVDAIARGFISDVEARERLAEPRRLSDTAKAELAAMARLPKTLTLHPAAVTRYLASTENLASTLRTRMVRGDEAISGAMRELVAAVIIHPDGKNDPTIQVTGKLAQLTGAPELFPQQTIPPTAVAGAGIEPATYGL